MSRKYALLSAALQASFTALARADVYDHARVIARDSVSLSADQLDVSSNSSADLFSYELIQLTDSVLSSYSSAGLNTSLFEFGGGNTTEDAAKRSLFTRSGTCKTAIGDPLWPSEFMWDVVDIFLGGALIKTTPLGAACYDDFGNYDAARCAYLTVNWQNDSYIPTEDPTAVNAEMYGASTCLPQGVFPYSDACTLGALPAYAVNVSTVAQVQLAVNLARNLNLRLVVKNTGHDFGGRSMGYSGLSVWTHNLKEQTFYDAYEQDGYSGPALKLGAGMQATEIYEACRDYGVTCVGGEGRTVGVTGGYILGGGHSPLSSMYGMASDQVLAMEVVTADGRFVTASNTSHSDLFWALRGGGGGTFGVVTSMVVKAHPKMPFATMSFSLTTADANMTTDVFWQAFAAYWQEFVALSAAGTYSYWFLMPLSAELVEFELQTLIAPNMTTAQLQALAAPMLANLTALGLDVQPLYAEYDDFYPAWDASFPLENWGFMTARQSSRLFPRASWDNATVIAATVGAIRAVVDAGVWAYGFNLAPGGPQLNNGLSSYPDSAVNPAWRDTVAHTLLSAFWDTNLWATGNATARAEMKQISDNVTTVWGDSWKRVSGGAGAYCSESDYIEPDWQEAFWGANYPRLVEVKRAYDPYGLFWVQNGVGSEGWAVQDYVLDNLPSQNSRLCKV